MNRRPLRDRITDQFAYRGDRADIWHAFDLLLDTDAYLNLGYSPWYRPHVLGASQRRLVTEIGARLTGHLPATDGVPLLDVGCGRGGPAIHLADRFEFRVTGVDLVPYNLDRATENATRRSVDVEWVLGDVAHLPIARDSVAAFTAIDTLVYLPDRARVFTQIGAALEDGGVFVLSDLVRQPALSDREQEAVDAFAAAWDMPPVGTVDTYTTALADAGFTVESVEDITPHSVGQFRKWTTVYLALLDSPLEPLLTRLFERLDLDPTVITHQVRRAHAALPFLGHVIVVATHPGP